MLKALLWKEFRELLPICTIAMGVQLLLIGYAVTDWRINHNSNDVTATFPFLYIASLVFALSAGLWQSARELNPNTYQFLLQRPIQRAKVFGVKIGFGAAICFLVGLLPTILFALSMSAFVRHDDDFMHALWGLCGGIWLIYFGALLSGLWPARWYGSRFYPLLAGIVLYILLIAVAYSVLFFVDWPPKHLLPVLGPIISIGFVLATLYVGESRDYS